jgi:hypothetical protein
MRASLQKLAALALMAATPSISQAFTTNDYFGSFPAATWGGSGIPNDAVAVAKQIVNGNTTITIAMSATGRYQNPQPTHNGLVPIYTVGAGSNCGIATDPVNCPSADQGALWNWNYYVAVTNINGATKSIKDYQIDIWYDFDPTGPVAEPDTAGLGRINVTQGVGLATVNLLQGSENLLFGWMAGLPAYTHVTPPAGSFNPNATGNYQFMLTVSNLSQSVPYDTVAMEVQVVPVPAAVWLFGSALGLVGLMRRRSAVA